MKREKKLLITFVVLVSLIFFFYVQNNSIVTTETTISSGKLPESMEGFKIVQLSDLHSKNFGRNQSVLVQKVNELKPDLIVFTGDLVDSKRYKEKVSLILMKELVEIAPTYFVTGNHEWGSGKFVSLESKLNDIGVQVMRNTADAITIGNDKAYIIGIDDPPQMNNRHAEQSLTRETIENSTKKLEDGYFKIFLSHRPEMFPLYSKYGFDLVFSGHAHGGQFRIPFVGGLIAPNQGLFPKYTAGKYVSDNTTMIVNRGLGNSIIPIRMFNRPEIVLVTLKSVNQ
ncbi:metallophosphoesterase [Priestia filamentosa]|uniref:metallophosphoesterase n=1 Tax=Priestia filamentosa TaxID=1402861 RepID=UPI003979DFFE